MNRGKSVIAAMVAVGVALAIFAWWARYSRSRQVLSTWGSEAVVAIRTGDKVELLNLGTPLDDSTGEFISIRTNSSANGAAGDRVVVENSLDITEAPGLIHCRHHLIHEKGFDWSASRPKDCDPDWTAGLRFRKAENVATMLLDLKCGRIYLVERESEVSMQPILSGALQSFLDEITPEDASDPSTNSASSQ